MINHLLRFFSCACFLLLSGAQVHASVEVFHSNDTALPVISSLGFLRDGQRVLRIEDAAAVSTAASFSPLPPDTNEVSIGYTADALWYRFILANRGLEAVSFLLEAGIPRLQDVRLYEPAGDGWRERRQGLVVPVSEREVRSRYPVFPVTLAPGEQRQFFLRVASDNAIALNLNVWAHERFLEREMQTDFFNGLQFGGVFLISIYGLLLYLGTRDRTYLYFSLMLGMFGCYEASIFQYGFQYLWPLSPDWALRSPGFFLALGCVGCGLLMSRLLQTRTRMPAMHRFLRWLIAVAFLAAVLVVWLEYRFIIQLVNVLLALTVVVSVVASIISIRRGFRPARLLFLAFLFLWVISSIRIGQVMGYVPSGFFSDYAQSWSVLLSGLLMAVSLSARTRLQGIRRLDAQREILGAQVVAREKLEEEVALRTIELKAAKERAEQADAAKTRFLARLSHELRTPLHSVLGNAGLMLGEARTEDDKRRLLSVQRSGRHQLALIEEILEFVRGDAAMVSLDPRPVWLRGMLQGVIDEMQPLARARDISLLLQVAPEAPDGVVLDTMRVRQVLLNLISNGCRHSHGREVSLQVQSGAVANGRVLLCFEVHDDGDGIAESERDAIFDPFWQSAGNTPGSGLGLGLPISGQWVRLMGGELEHSERPVGGSLFRFCIDVALSVQMEAQPGQASETGGVDVGRQRTASALLASGAWAALAPGEEGGSHASGDASGLRRPSDRALAKLRVAAGMGLISDIDDWVRETAASEPEASGFVEEVRVLLGRVEIRRIRDLAGGPSGQQAVDGAASGVETGETGKQEP